MVEHYFQAIGIISVGVFYKNLENIIYDNTYRQEGGLLDQWQITEPVNGGSSLLYGVELNWQQQFTFLPGVLRGLGIFANYTYTESKADLQFRDWDELPGQAANAGNLALTYDLRGLNARLSMNYNGEFLAQVNQAPEYDRINAAHKQLDFSASYQFTPQINVFTEWSNLLNEADRMYIGNSSRPRYSYYYGVWGRLGVRLKM